MVQVLTAHRAQPLAIFAAERPQRNAQQDLLAQNIFKQQSLPLVVADFCFDTGYREFFFSSIRSQRPVEQIELALDIFDHRLETACAGKLELG